MRPACAIALLVLAVPATASADLTAFVGVNPTPESRPVRGFAAGVSLLIVAFEFEYARTSKDAAALAPELRTYMGNALLQTPVAVGGIQLYATAGGGVYREALGDSRRTNVGVNVGGGIKMALAGPLRLRLDYRVYTLSGTPQHSRPQRFYAGLNLRF
jgi:opacity protein-like surface antigen